MRRYARGLGRRDDPAEQEARIREAFAKIFDPLIPDPPEGMFTQPVDEFIAKILAEMNCPGGDAAEHDQEAGKPDAMDADPSDERDR